jgi:predicted ATP-dependent protease
MTTEIKADELRRTCDPEQLDFETTEELEPLEAIIGQERALRSISFGIDIEAPGYHMFALGSTGTGKASTIRKFLERKSISQPAPDDWVYVNDFTDQDRPRALRLPTGGGSRLRDAMNRFVEDLKSRIPQALESKEYEERRRRVVEDLENRRKQMFKQLEELAEQKGVRLIQAPQGLAIAPVRDGEVFGPDEIAKMDTQEREELEAIQEELQERVRETMREVQRLQKTGKERAAELDRETAVFAVGDLLDNIRDDFEGHEKVRGFLDDVKQDILDNIQTLKHLSQGEGSDSAPQALRAGPRAASDPDAFYDRYRVNLLVANAEGAGLPVVYEMNPTYHNLVGRVDYKGELGTLVTNFHLIKPGALHRANGGYLMVEALDVLSRPFAYDALKRCLKNGCVKIEPMGSAYGLITTRTLEPEPIELDVKVVLLGPSLLYYLLQQADPEFTELFKVKADFAEQMEWSPQTLDLYARFIGQICREEKLKHFDRSGVVKLIEESARMVAHREKLSTRFSRVVDLIREANYWAQQDGDGAVGATAVSRAVTEGIFRANRIEERLRELIAEGSIRIETSGARVGQVNGLSVLSLGDYAFGKPSRITARTHVGGRGVVSIDRETEFGGRIHNKGALILSGYLGGLFAQDQPLSLSASVTFEQLYEDVEGDSASSTELYALLSSLADLPLRQDLAVTGSVDQLGNVQAIGGVNAKIEGFFDVCRELGSDGEPGVLIPRANVRHLMLREDVVAAVAAGEFHVHAVDTIADGIELLAGVAAGEPDGAGHYPEGSVFGRVQARLKVLAEKAREFRKQLGASPDEAKS